MVQMCLMSDVPMPHADYTPVQHILLVEADDTSRTNTSHLLEYAGYRVTSTPDVETARCLIQKNKFDVVITDIAVRSTDGFDLLHFVRNQEQPAAVVILSSITALDSIIRALRSGACDYLLKPCSPENFLERISIAVKRHAAELVRRHAIRSIGALAAELRDSDRESRADK